MEKSIKKNFFYNLLFQIFGVIVPLVTTPYLSRVLEPDGIGIKSYTNSVVTYFIILAAFGLNTYGQREISMYRDDKEKYSKIFFEIVYNRFLNTFIVLLAYILCIKINLFGKENIIIYYILSINIIAGAFDISWFFRGMEDFKKITIRNFFVTLSSTALIFVFVREKKDLNLAILLNSLLMLFSYLSLWGLIRKYIVFTKVSFKGIISHFKGSLVYFIPTISISIYSLVDRIMIGIITKSNFENGYYEQADKLIKIGLTIFFSLNMIMRSRVSHLFQKGDFPQIKRRIYKSFNFLFVLGFGIVFGFFIITNQFVGWFFGDGYEDVKILLLIGAPLTLIIGSSNIVGSHYMTPCGYQKKSNIALIIGSFISFTLNLYFIKNLGAVGAMITAVISEIVICVIYFANIKHFIEIKIILKMIIKPLIAGTIMLLCVKNFTKALPVSVYTTFIQIIFGMIIYFIVLLISREKFVLTEIDNFKKIIFNKKNK